MQINKSSNGLKIQPCVWTLTAACKKCASLTGKLLGCKISSCPSEDAALVSKLAPHSSATSLQTFHCPFYLTSVASEDYLESGASFICFLSLHFVFFCRHWDETLETWRAEEWSSISSLNCRFRVTAGSLWFLWCCIRITHIYSTWIISAILYFFFF